MPVHIVKELNVCRREARKLAQHLDHMPTSEEIANALGKSVESVNKVLELNDRVSSLDVPVGDNEKSLADTIRDHQTNSPEVISGDENLFGKLASWIDELPEKQREVLIRRFGLREHKQETLDQVGREVGLTRERVRQIQINGLRRLNDLLRQNGLSREVVFSETDLEQL